MPAATTHIEFAQAVFNRLPATYQNQISDASLFFLGSQGPDLFFFSNAFVLPGSLSQYGQTMHHHYVKETLNYLHDYTKDHPSLIPYFYGYLCHYALDTYTHPIINYYARKQARFSQRPEIECHFAIEAEIDVHALRRKGHTIDSYNVYRRLNVNKEYAKELGVLYHNLFRDVMGWTVSESQVRKAIRDIAHYTKLLRPNSIRKYRTVIYLENLAHAPHAISGMMLIGKGGKDSEVLNKNHDEYFNINDPTIKYRSSFEELIKQAEDYAIELIESYSDAKINNDFLGDPIR